MSRLTEVKLPLLVKLGSLVVHAEEFFSGDGHPFDKTAMESIINDPEVRAWLKVLDDAGFLPKKRVQL